MPVNVTSKPAQPKLKVTYVKPGDLTAYENNPRNNDPEIPNMVALITEFGFTVPMLVKDGVIVDGHLRHKASLQMGLAKVPVLDITHLSDAQVRALRLAVNRQVERTDWDEAKLAAELQAVVESGMEVHLTGFDLDEAERLMKQAMEAIGGKTADADAGTKTDAYVSITFHMTLAERDKIKDRLEEHRLVHALETRSQALVAMLVGPKA